MDEYLRLKTKIDLLKEIRAEVQKDAETLPKEMQIRLDNIIGFKIIILKTLMRKLL